MSKYQKILCKSKTTQNILEEIISSLSKSHKKSFDYTIPLKNTPSTSNSELSDSPPRNIKQIDIVYSEIFYETLEYHKMIQSMTSFNSESNITLKNIKKYEILNKLGINLKEDTEKIISNMQFPLIYYILYNFMISIREDYQRVMNLFLNKQNDIISKCEALINDNINNPIKTLRQQEINELFNKQPVKSILKKQWEGINLNRSSFKRPFFLDPVNLEKIQEETNEEKCNTSEIVRKDSESETDTIFIPRANTLKKSFGKSKKSVEEEEKIKMQIKEGLKNSGFRKQSVAPEAMNSNKLLKNVIIKFDTDEDKLAKREKCPFIEQIEIF